MSKAAIFTMKLEPELRADFIAAAEASHRPASQVVRELMREFVSRHQDREDHRAFLLRKVERARSFVDDGIGRENDEVERTFAARRAEIADRA